MSENKWTKESQQKYLNNYLKENYFKPTIRIPKDKRDVLEQVSKERGKSINQLLIEAFEKQYRVDISGEDRIETLRW